MNEEYLNLKINALIVKLIEKQNTPVGAENTNEGKAEQSLTSLIPPL